MLQVCSDTLALCGILQVCSPRARVPQDALFRKHAAAGRTGRPDQTWCEDRLAALESEEAMQQLEPQSEA